MWNQPWLLFDITRICFNSPALKPLCRKNECLLRKPFDTLLMIYIFCINIFFCFGFNIYYNIQYMFGSYLQLSLQVIEQWFSYLQAQFWNIDWRHHWQGIWLFVRFMFCLYFGWLFHVLQTLAKPPNYYINIISSKMLSLGCFSSQNQPLDTLWGWVHYTLTP